MPLKLSEVYALAGNERVALVKDGPIFYMVMNTPFNMIDFDFLECCNKIIDKVEESTEEAVLVTIGSKRLFCSGFDMKFWEAKPLNKPLSIILAQMLFARLITLSIPSLAIFNGHSIAGGVFIGLCHDEIWMTSDPKAFVWVNENSFGGILPSGFAQLLKETTSPFAGRQLMAAHKFSP
jgi:enoyl-CoA hydratase/carnithine racemase